MGGKINLIVSFVVQLVDSFISMQQQPRSPNGKEKIGTLQQLDVHPCQAGDALKTARHTHLVRVEAALCAGLVHGEDLVGTALGHLDVVSRHGCLLLERGPTLRVVLSVMNK